MEQNKQSGFTLVELVMVLVILSVISATAIPKFFDKNVYAERAFFDDTLHAIQYAQKLAVATGCAVRVSILSNSYSLARRGTASSTSCPLTGSVYSLAIPHPGTGASNYSGSENGITLSSSSTPFYFYSSGSASADITLTVNGFRTIKVIAETGFVYDSTP